MAEYDRLNKTGLQYVLEKIKDKINASVPADMTGATAEAAGTHGQVPAPQAGDQVKFLRGDGTWATVTIPDVPVKGVQKNGTDLVPDEDGKVNVIVPTKTSDLENDSNWVDEDTIDGKISTALTSAYKAGGSKAFADLTGLNVEANLGLVYNITDAFTTTADFVEGAGKSYPAGTNVAVVNAGTAEAPSYKFDVMAGFVDLSGYVQASEMTVISNDEIDTIVTTVFGA